MNKTINLRKKKGLLTQQGKKVVIEIEKLLEYVAKMPTHINKDKIAITKSKFPEIKWSNAAKKNSKDTNGKLLPITINNLFYDDIKINFI